MKKTIKIKGKEINFPMRILTKKELDKMGVDFVIGGIFLNKAKPGDDFESLPNRITDNMLVINYHDFSAVQFSERLLKDSIKEQLSLSDIVILPYFKNENELDLKRKIEYAENLKLQEDRFVILEMGYKNSILVKELSDLSHNFDMLSIFYGARYGHYPSFERVVKRLVSFKRTSEKEVIVMATPLRFSGEDVKDSILMPCFSMVTDSWCKNWKGGGSSKITEIKVTDHNDKKNKTYTQWLESGYLPNTQIPVINRTVYDLFRKDSKKIREEFEGIVLDSTLEEVNNINPLIIESYLTDNFHMKYISAIIISYNEKIISYKFPNKKLLELFPESQIQLLKNELRKIYYPSKINTKIEEINNSLAVEKEVSVQRLLSIIRK